MAHSGSIEKERTFHCYHQFIIKIAAEENSRIVATITAEAAIVEYSIVEELAAQMYFLSPNAFSVSRHFDSLFPRRCAQVN